MRKTLLRTLLGVCVVALVGAVTAEAITLRVGNIVIAGDGGFTPTTLPKYENAPIKLYGHAKFKTTDGTLPSPLRTLTIEYDRHGAVETRGLPVCTRAKLLATDTRTARRNCRGAIVGKGFGKAIVKFPEQPPIPASSPITIFNGPRRHGNPTVLAHAYLSVPAPTTYIVPVEIQKVHHGRYGFKTVAEIPPIAGGSGAAVYGRLKIGREWKYKGKTLSFANAHCADGRLQAKAEFGFRNGDSVEGTVFKPCKVRK